MKRSWLKNKSNNTCLIEDLKLYKVQCNVVTKLNKSLNQGHFKEKLPKR